MVLGDGVEQVLVPIVLMGTGITAVPPNTFTANFPTASIATLQYSHSWPGWSEWNSFLGKLQLSFPWLLPKGFISALEPHWLSSAISQAPCLTHQPWPSAFPPRDLLMAQLLWFAQLCPIAASQLSPWIPDCWVSYDSHPASCCSLDSPD